MKKFILMLIAMFTVSVVSAQSGTDKIKNGTATEGKADMKAKPTPISSGRLPESSPGVGGSDDTGTAAMPSGSTTPDANATTRENSTTSGTPATGNANMNSPVGTTGNGTTESSPGTGGSDDTGTAAMPAGAGDANKTTTKNKRSSATTKK